MDDGERSNADHGGTQAQRNHWHQKLGRAAHSQPVHQRSRLPRLHECDRYRMRPQQTDRSLGSLGAAISDVLGMNGLLQIHTSDVRQCGEPREDVSELLLQIGAVRRSLL